MNKKIFYLSIVLLMGLLLTGCGTKDEKTEIPSTPEVKYSHKIGDQVTLKDGSIWYVIENSEAGSDTVTLFASQNIKNDASGWTTTPREYQTTFDEANARSKEKNSYCPSDWGCNIYAAQEGIITQGTISGTVTEDSTIKKFLDGIVTNYINDVLQKNEGSNIDSIRLITIDEICNIINESDSSNNCTFSTMWDYFKKSLQNVFTNVPSWLYSTNYWIMTPDASGSSFVSFAIANGCWTSASADDSNYGARPVIVINKSNIK